MEFIVKKSIDLAARPAEVWDALTNPKKTKKYFFNSKVISTWKKGDRITFKGKMFLLIRFELTGEILDIEPLRLLKYTLKNESDKTGSFSTVTAQITDHANGSTTLEITDDVGGGKGVEKRFKRSVKGWSKVLKQLKKFLEKEG